MSIMDYICLRPHHGLCIQHYEGKGYDEKFVKNMNNITDMLVSNPNQKIIITAEADALCACCPNLHDGICDMEEKVKEYDQKCLSLCGLHIGRCLEWKMMRAVMFDNIIKDMKLKSVCGDCVWIPLCQNLSKYSVAAGIYL